MAKILAPNKDYTGESASVKFEKGVGETDDSNLITWFEEHGYKVEKSSSKATNAKTENAGTGKTVTETKPKGKSKKATNEVEANPEENKLPDGEKSETSKTASENENAETENR